MDETPYSFPRRFEPLKKYAASFGVVLSKSNKQEEKYIVRREGERKFSYAQNLDIAAILVEELIQEF